VKLDPQTRAVIMDEDAALAQLARDAERRIVDALHRTWDPDQERDPDAVLDRISNPPRRTEQSNGGPR